MIDHFWGYPLWKCGLPLFWISPSSCVHICMYIYKTNVYICICTYIYIYIFKSRAIIKFQICVFG